MTQRVIMSHPRLEQYIDPSSAQTSPILPSGEEDGRRTLAGDTTSSLGNDSEAGGSRLSRLFSINRRWIFWAQQIILSSPSSSLSLYLCTGRARVRMVEEKAECTLCPRRRKRWTNIFCNHHLHHHSHRHNPLHHHHCNHRHHQKQPLCFVVMIIIIICKWSHL